MKTVASSAEPPENAGTVLAASGHKTGQQVGILVAVLNELGGFLSSPEGFQHIDEPESKAREAASSTYELANLQLRNILDDQARWTAAGSTRVEDVEVKVAKARLATMEQMNRPHRMLNAKVQFFPEHGQWIAWIGELKTGMLHGAGMTPERALANFDIVYAKGYPAQPKPKQKKPRKT